MAASSETSSNLSVAEAGGLEQIELHMTDMIEQHHEK